MSLEVLWFCLICVLWTGYLVLEGFDFGVGMLSPFLARRDEEGRKTVMDTIGPIWDGNEVWLIVAGGATFAAFPQWYATMFSGFYLALLVILVLLIMRVVSFEWRDKSDSTRWRSFWSWANFGCSALLPVLWGVGLSNLLAGVPIDGDGEFAGNFWSLFSPYTVFAGVAVALLCLTHGATFLSLRLDGELRDRAHAFASRFVPLSAVAAAALLAWTVVVGADVNGRDLFPGIVPALIGGLAASASVPLIRARREGWAFVATAVTIGAWVVTLFTEMYPRVMVSSSDFVNSLSIEDAASSHYTLTVMTVVAAVLTPVVLLYQGWTYHVFKARLGLTERVGSPIDLLAKPDSEPTQSTE